MSTNTALRALASVGLLCTLVGCGSDDSTGAIDATSDTVEVQAVDYAYLNMPSSVPVGTKMTLTNGSKIEAHELVAVKLPEGETRPAADLVQLPPEELGALMPGVRSVVLAAPDARGTAVVGDGRLNEPGRYLMLCLIPTGADPDEYLTKAATSDGPPDVAGGPPHIAEGMFGELTVEG